MRLMRGIAAGIALCLAGGMTCALAQNYPDKLARLVVPNTPGSTADNLAQVIGPIWSKVIGQPVVVEYRAGAGSLLRTEYVAKSAPDGYNVKPQ